MRVLERAASPGEGSTGRATGGFRAQIATEVNSGSPSAAVSHPAALQHVLLERPLQQPGPVEPRRARSGTSVPPRTPSAARAPLHRRCRHCGQLENLFPGIRGVGSALAFFAERGIQWWANARSGEPVPDATYVGPTRNLASPQVSCVSFLLPLASVPGAHLALLQRAMPT